jgi:hypothetical protein
MQRLAGMLPGHPREVSTQNVNCDSCRHENCANPEAPVVMHASPVGSWIGLTRCAAVPFAIVLIACHRFSLCRIKRLAWLSNYAARDLVKQSSPSLIKPISLLRRVCLKQHSYREGLHGMMKLDRLFVGSGDPCVCGGP